MGKGGPSLTCLSGFYRPRTPLPTPDEWGILFTSANEGAISFQIYGTYLELHNYACAAFGIQDGGTFTNLFKKLDLFGNYGDPFYLVNSDFRWFHPSLDDLRLPYTFTSYLFDGSIYWDYLGDPLFVENIQQLFHLVNTDFNAIRAARHLLFSNILFRRLLKMFFIRDLLDYATGAYGQPYSNRWKIRLWVGMNIDYALGEVFDVYGLLGSRPFQLRPWPVGGRVIKNFAVYFSGPGSILEEGIREVNFYIRGEKFPIQGFYYLLTYEERISLFSLAEIVAEKKGFSFDRSLIPPKFFQVLYY